MAFRQSDGSQGRNPRSGFREFVGGMWWKRLRRFHPTTFSCAQPHIVTTCASGGTRAAFSAEFVAVCGESGCADCTLRPSPCAIGGRCPPYHALASMP